MSNETGLAAVAAAAAGAVRAPEVVLADPEPPKVQADAVSDVAAQPLLAGAEINTPDLATVRSDAAKAERGRLLALDGITLPGCESIIAAAKEGGGSPESTALEMVRHIKATGALDAVKALSTAAASVPALMDAPVDPVSAAAPRPAASTPEGWAADYAASPNLQAEFGSKETYVAFRRAEAAGRARILGRKD